MQSLALARRFILSHCTCDPGCLVQTPLRPPGQRTQNGRTLVKLAQKWQFSHFGPFFPDSPDGAKSIFHDHFFPISLGREQNPRFFQRGSQNPRFFQGGFLLSAPQKNQGFEGQGRGSFHFFKFIVGSGPWAVVVLVPGWPVLPETRKLGRELVLAFLQCLKEALGATGQSPSGKRISSESCVLENLNPLKYGV